MSLALEERLCFENVVHSAQIINLRTGAAQKLLSSMGVMVAPGDFLDRALVHIRGMVACGERPAGPLGAGIDTTRVCAYAEHSVVLAAGQRVTGKHFRECGYSRQVFTESDHEITVPARRGPGWLPAFKLPNSRHVDRRLCAEFQVLQELCQVFVPSGEPTIAQPPWPEVVGVVALLTSVSPCMSCIGAIRHFQLLFPEVEIGVAMFG